MTKSPAFQFYPADWLSDANVSSMSLEQEGAYIRLICYCWTQGSLRNDEAYLCALVGLEPEQFEVIETILKTCFRERSRDRDECTEFYHPRLEKERAKQRVRSKKCADSGKLGNDKRWGNKEKGQNKKPSRTRPIRDRESIANGSRTGRSSSSCTSKEVPPKPPTGGPGDLSEIDSQSRTQTQNLRDEILVEVLAVIDKAGVKRKKFRGVDVIELEARHFVEDGRTPEDLEELARFSQSQPNPAAYLAGILKGGEASWHQILGAAKHERLRIASKRLENGETQSYQEDQESPAAGNVADEGAIR